MSISKEVFFWCDIQEVTDDISAALKGRRWWLVSWVSLCGTHMCCAIGTATSTLHMLLSVCRFARESSVWPSRCDGCINFSPVGSSSSLCRKRCCLCITCRGGSVWCRCVRRATCVGMALPPLRCASAGLGEQDMMRFHSEFPGRASLCRRRSGRKSVSCSGMWHAFHTGRQGRPWENPRPSPWAIVCCLVIGDAFSLSGT